MARKLKIMENENLKNRKNRKNRKNHKNRKIFRSRRNMFLRTALLKLSCLKGLHRQICRFLQEAL